MSKFIGMRWLVVVVGAAMLLVLAAACTKEVEVVKEVEVIKEKEVEVVKEVEVIKTVEVVKEVEVPGETVVVEKVVVKEVEGDRYVRNVHGELVEKPQYGGTIAIAWPSDWSDFDPWYNGQSGNSVRLVLEKMGHINMAVPRDEFDWTQAGYLQIDGMTGALAESWEQPDLLTTIFHIRKGVNWHDKPPMNGRELTAHDVEFSFHRTIGLGEFAEAGPAIYPQLAGLPIESIEATDKYSVEVKASSFSFNTLDWLLFYSFYDRFIQPPEVIKQYGDLKDWRHLVGTGPYELTDYVSGTAVTYTRNPNYWYYDPRFPDLELRLPYADEVKIIVTPDLTTRLAALRTGKSAFIKNTEESSLATDLVLGLQRTNPELVTVKVPGSSPNPAFLTDRPPFNDINVRIAMQKAINVEEIANSYYLGYADPTPWGVASVGSVGMYVPYDDWPEEVKGEYEYDPEEAERLLDEAGYPRGSDGIRFTTNWDVRGTGDVDLPQLVKSYWDEIGVDVYLNVIADSALYQERSVARMYEGLTACECRHKPLDPLASLSYRFHSTNETTVGGVNDPTFDALIDDAMAATDREEYLKLVREMDMYFIKQMWTLYVPPVVDAFVLHQPWLKGYRGELGASDDDWIAPIMYQWVDQELKKAMGH